MRALITNNKEVCTIPRRVGAHARYDAKVQASSFTCYSGIAAGTPSCVTRGWKIQRAGITRFLGSHAGLMIRHGKPDGNSNQYHYSYTYDNLNRLTSATFGFGSSGSNSDFQLSGIEYDRAVNLQYLQRRDQNGNLTSRSDKLSKISYDWRNLPEDFDMTSGQEIVDNYNADGQRIIRELKGGAWAFYVKDGDKTLAVIDQNGLNHFNLFGNSLFGRYEPSDGIRRYYLKDNLGTTRAVVDNAGNV